MTKLALDLIKQEAEEKTGYLELGRCGLTPQNELLSVVWNELGKLSHLHTLILSNEWYEWNREKENWENRVSKNRGSNNYLQDHPSTLKNLPSLSTYICSGGDIEQWGIDKIPQFRNSDKVTYLGLGGNQISELEQLQQLTELLQLFLGYNQINSTVAINNLLQLQVLNLSYNYIKLIELDNLVNLKYLDIGNNNIFTIKHLSGLSDLRLLYLNNNKISKIENLNKLKRLETLNLVGNQISCVENLDQLIKLKKLYIYDNNISSIENLNQLSQLQILHLGSNKLSSIEKLDQLTQLQELDLSNNQISSIENLDQLSSLHTLDLRANQLKDITPLSYFIKEHNILVSWEGNKGIILGDNPLTIPPIEIVLRGTDAVRSYFTELAHARGIALEDFVNTEIKIVLVGNSEAGKSTLLEYLKGSSTKKKKANEHSTEWLQVIPIPECRYTPPKLNGLALRALVYDFGGQDYYHDTHPMFFTSNTVYLLLWDKYTNGNKLLPSERPQNNNTSIQHYHLEYWLAAVSKYTKINTYDPDKRQQITPLLVVQNKIDRPTTGSNAGHIAHIDQKKLTKDYEFIYDFVAISLHNKQRLGVFDALFTEMLQQTNILGGTYPGTIQLILDRLNEYSQQVNNSGKVVSFDNLLAACQQHSLLSDYTPENLKNALSNYLQPLGKVLYLPDNATIVTDPNWAITQIRTLLLNLRDASDLGGEFTLAIAQDRLLPNTSDQLQALLDLMLKFKIIFRNPHQPDTYIAPHYLPQEPTPQVALFLHTLPFPLRRFVCTNIVHKSLILDFFADYYPTTYTHDTDPVFAYYWQRGVVLRQGIGLVFVHFCHTPTALADAQNASYIDVFVLHPPEDNRMLDNVLETLRLFANSWNMQEQVSSNGIDFVPLKTLNEKNEAKHLSFEYNGKVYFVKEFNAYLENKFKSKKIFISYSHKDLAHTNTKGQVINFRNDLEARLKPLLREKRIEEIWYDHKILAGADWDTEIERNLRTADIILMLISPDFWASDYIYQRELPIIRARLGDTNDHVLVIPILLRPENYWKEGDYARTQSLPTDKGTGKLLAMTKWDDIDDAWAAVIEGIKDLLK